MAQARSSTGRTVGFAEAGFAAARLVRFNSVLERLGMALARARPFASESFSLSNELPESEKESELALAMLSCTARQRCALCCP